MFVFLSKVLPLFVYPVGLLTILISLVLIFGKRENFRRFVLIVALLLLLVSGNKWLATSVAHSLEWRYLPFEEVPEAEAIVVLGGATLAQDYPRSNVELNGAADRVLHTADLYLAGKAPLIISSGGSIDWQQIGDSTPAKEMADLLVRFGVPQEAIVLQTQSYNTHEDAVYSAELLNEMGIKRIILVTSALHMPRSVALFVHEGFEVIPAPTDYRVTQSDWEALWQVKFPNTLINMIPSESNISDLTTALKEYIGIMVYRLRGWL
ncbi:MAG: YdcF family protein [Anaerolineaceae bacterium]|nr:YdcF family protein [Anaerolineaceae bacterium]